MIVSRVFVKGKPGFGQILFPLADYSTIFDKNSTKKNN